MPEQEGSPAIAERSCRRRLYSRSELWKSKQQRTKNRVTFRTELKAVKKTAGTANLNKKNSDSLIVKPARGQIQRSHIKVLISRVLPVPRPPRPSKNHCRWGYPNC